METLGGAKPRPHPPRTIPLASLGLAAMLRCRRNRQAPHAFALCKTIPAYSSESARDGRPEPAL